MELGRSASKSTSINTLANESLDMELVDASHCRGLPRTLAILDKHIENQHSRGRLGNLTQTGAVDISAGLK
jgi:hypothetical protein